MTDLADGVPTAEYDCLRCGYHIDAAAAAGEEEIVPAEGSVSICLSCGNIAIFTGSGATLGLRLPTVEEFQSIIDEPAVVSILLARHRASNLSWMVQKP